jgi:hypothetical protein
MSVVSTDDTRAFPELHAVLAELAAEDRSSWSGPARATRVLELQSAIERLQAEQVRAVGEWDRDRAWQADAATSATAWLVHHADMAPGAAGRLVRSARLAHRHLAIGDALAAGAVTVAKVEALARVERDREEVFERDVGVLVEVAARHPVREVSALTGRWRHLADDEASLDEPDRVYERRFLYASSTLGGTVRIDAELDPEGGAVFLAALDRYARPDPADDPLGPRTLAQRRADALVELAAAATTAADDDEGSSPRPAIDVLVDVETLAGVGLMPDGLRGQRLRRLESATCDTVDGGPISVETVRRLLCDSKVGTIVMKAGEIVGMTTRSRFPTETQKRAVIARDRHCRFPGCDRPPRWCDVHHVVPVHVGGKTVLVNLVLLCRRHHRAVHEGGWRLRRDADGTVTATPPSMIGRGPPLV